MWINGQLVVDDWDPHGLFENTADVQLSEDQFYTFEMDFYQWTDAATAQLLWSNSTITKQAVPQSQLYSGTAPIAPSNLAVTAASGTQLNLSWTDNSNNETGFSIERKIGASGTYAVVGTVGPNVTTYSDGGLVPDTTYYYHVQATNFAANSLYSNEASALTPVPPLGPSDAAVTHTTTSSITLTWTNNATNADGYRIIRFSPIQDSIVVATNLPPSATTFTDVGAVAGIIPGTEYQYHIYAYNVAGYSATAEADTATLTLPPAGLAASGADGSINLTWTAPTYDGDPSNSDLQRLPRDIAGERDPARLFRRHHGLCGHGIAIRTDLLLQGQCYGPGRDRRFVGRGQRGAHHPFQFFGDLRLRKRCAHRRQQLHRGESHGEPRAELRSERRHEPHYRQELRPGFHPWQLHQPRPRARRWCLPYNGVNYAFVANYYGGAGRDLVLQWANVRPLAWGNNNLGQLGNGSLAGSSVPVAIDTSGVLSGKIVVAMAGGAAHSLALCSDGTLAAWGENFYGELGNNSEQQYQPAGGGGRFRRPGWPDRGRHCRRFPPQPGAVLRWHAGRVGLEWLGPTGQ